MDKNVPLSFFNKYNIVTGDKLLWRKRNKVQHIMLCLENNHPPCGNNLPHHPPPPHHTTTSLIILIIFPQLHHMEWFHPILIDFTNDLRFTWSKSPDTQSVRAPSYPSSWFGDISSRIKWSFRQLNLGNWTKKKPKKIKTRVWKTFSMPMYHVSDLYRFSSLHNNNKWLQSKWDFPEIYSQLECKAERAGRVFYPSLW